MQEHLFRSVLFTPANNRRFIDSALKSDADVIILDLEDSVPVDQKSTARDIIREYAQEGLLGHVHIYVRINNIDSEEFIDDIEKLILPCIDGFMPSKIESAFELRFIDKLLGLLERRSGIEEGFFKLMPLIETTSALSDVQTIAHCSSRLVALCFGGEDYTNDIGSVYTYQESALVIPRALIVNAARSAGLEVLDTPYVNYKDVDGFRETELKAYHNGFSGCLLVNPVQIDVANNVFFPSDDLIEYSRKIICAEEDAVNKGSKIATLNGQMIGPPMLKRAESVLNQLELKQRKDKS